MSGALAERVAQALEAPVSDPVRRFAQALGEAAGSIGVLFYGSNLRTGSLDGVLDFYVLTEGEVESGIWPRVSYHERMIDGHELRAKVATMTLATFAAAASGELLDTTIWARFVQPSALAWRRDAAAKARIASAVEAAAVTAARLAVALGPVEGTAADYWRALFRATYKAEFRVEAGGREDSILAANAAHFDGLLPLALEAAKIEVRQTGDVLRPAMFDDQKLLVMDWWKRRQRLGKAYNVMRLLKAATTFDGAARYAAWKIERHTGVPVELTPWREAHPVLAAPGVLWRVWRAKKARA